MNPRQRDDTVLPPSMRQVRTECLPVYVQRVNRIQHDAIIYDFENQQVHLCDLDSYRPGPRPENTPSRRVMEKIGLIYQGTRPYREGEAVWYALDRATWERSTEADGRASAVRSQTPPPFATGPPPPIAGVCGAN